ncbi:MAG: ComEA family DNA-binding protein [Oscillospiraceae bacterium]|nr:ComEA family DNA-binding protein [Oscillospiraceae bacterium]
MPGTTRKHVIAAVSAVVAAALMLSFGYYAGRRINRDEYAVFYTSHADEETVRSLPGLVSLNTADEEELTRLDGIGPGLAGRIIEYREEHGPFLHVSDIMNVPGIGEGIYSKIKDSVTVD